MPFCLQKLYSQDVFSTLHVMHVFKVYIFLCTLMDIIIPYRFPAIYNKQNTYKK